MNTFLYVTYDKLTGEIFQTGRAGLDDDFTWLDNEKWLLEGVAKSKEEYVDVSAQPPEIIVRPESTAVIDTLTVAADGISQVIITNIELNTEVFINSVSFGIYVATSLELTFDTIGLHTVRLERFPSISKEFVVNAN